MNNILLLVGLFFLVSFTSNLEIPQLVAIPVGGNNSKGVTEQVLFQIFLR